MSIRIGERVSSPRCRGLLSDAWRDGPDVRRELDGTDGSLPPAAGQSTPGELSRDGGGWGRVSAGTATDRAPSWDIWPAFGTPRGR